MEFKQAIDALKKLEGGADLASAIESHVTKLDEKIYQVIGEKRTTGAKAQNLETVVGAIGKILGIEGDVETVLNGLESKVREVNDGFKTHQTKVTELETRATAAEGKVKSLERSGKISQVATKAGAVAEVLEKLLGDKIDEMAIADDGVKLGDKPLREYCEADAILKPFLPALFPQQSATPTPTPTPAPVAPKLPTGSPAGQTGKTPVGSYLSAAGFGPKTKD